jgi:anti-anti-sigma factor
VSSVDVVQNVDDTAVTVRVEGEIDSGTVGSLSEALAEALTAAQSAGVLVIDLDAVTYFGSAGLNAVLSCHEQGAARGVAVRIVATNAEVTRPIEVTKLENVLRPHESVQAALTADGQ